LQTVSEQEADSTTLDLYGDIKSTMGVALVNLVWRRLAVNPSVFRWSWLALKPHYQNNAIPCAAWVSRQRLEPPPVDPFSAEERESVKQELLQIDVIDDVLRTYERGNAQNLIALCFLQMCLDGRNHTPETTSAAKEQSGKAQTEPAQDAQQQADGRFGDIPGLPKLDSLPDDIQLLISRAAETWVPGQYRGLTPSVFRHLAHWPGLLALLTGRLDRLEDTSNNAIGILANKAVSIAGNEAAGLVTYSTSKALPELNPTDRQWLQQVLDLFIHGMLARGVVIVPTLRLLLAKP